MIFWLARWFFLVALPLCLGIALASQAPIVAGLLSGIIGGIVVGALSGSHTSVSGPAAGLTAVIAVQIATLGSFKAFLMAVVICGIIQIIMGLMRAGFIAAFFPSSVINGLLTAIGLILILKQLPHLVGWDSDFEGEMSFFQHDHKNTFSEIIMCFFNWHYGALIIGVLSLSILIVWGKNKFLKKSLFPAQLAGRNMCINY
jgi:MFS superfamily sulfate permease-like transporter